jgi:hypothetical protein
MFAWPAKWTVALKGGNQAAEHQVWSWRNHACRRTTFRGSTPASLPASPRVRRMNPQPQHRIILVFRRLQNLCVSSGPQCPASLFSSLCQPPQRIQSRLATSAHSRQRQLRNSSEPAQSYTRPIGSREGGFLEVAVSEAPLQSSSIRLPAMKMAGRYTRNQ